MASKLAEAFARIFDGLSRSGGRYVVPNDAKADAHGKILGRAWTAHSPITLELWEAHLSGKQTTVTNEETGEPLTGALGLGVVPIREDATVVFGAFDVDVYPLDLNALLAKIKAIDLPVILCRTKSGGAHGYVFTSEPVPAELIRQRLSEWIVALGYPGIEVFPKQALLSEHSDGSWINIPYSGGKRSVRYALKPDGSAMTPEEFIEAVAAIAVSKADLEAFELPQDEIASDDFYGGPPCLQTLARVGFGDWQNNSIFNIAIYLKMRHGAGWENNLAMYNEKYMVPPLSASAVAAIIKSVKKKAYLYKCKDQPISAVCNRSVCLRCEFGVGGDGTDSGVTFGELSKVETDPAIWILPVDGKEIELSTSDLTDQRKLRHAVIEKLSVWPNLIEGVEWQKMMKAKLAAAKIIMVPLDGTRAGQFWAHLANFCTARSRARNLDEILGGKAWTDPKTKRVYFISTDFLGYLASHRFSVAERDAWRFLRPRGIESENKVLKGKSVIIWSVPAFPEQTEPHDIPRGKPPVEM